MATHELKTWPEFFERLLDGSKTFEVRHNDRDFRAGDILNLREWYPESGVYTGRRLLAEVTYILSVYEGLKPGFVVMAVDLESEGSAPIHSGKVDR